MDAEWAIFYFVLGFATAGVVMSVVVGRNSHQLRELQERVQSMVDRIKAKETL